MLFSRCPRRYYSVPVGTSRPPLATLKLPLNSIHAISPHEVVATGLDSILLDLPKRNGTEAAFDNAKKVYISWRERLLPQNEGLWLMVNTNPFQIVIAEHELGVRTLKRGFGFKAAYYDCLGREVLLEEVCEESFCADEESAKIAFPTFDKNLGTHIWNKAVWLPAKFHRFGTHGEQFMKLDTGAVGIGMPSVYFDEHSELYKEKVIRGVTGIQQKRIASGLTISCAGRDVEIEEAFEHDKFLLGFKWYRHYQIELDVTKSPPLVICPNKLQE